MNKLNLILLLTTILSLQTKSQTTLYPGDLAIITVNSDGNKNFDVLFLKEIEAGTVIHFTDNAWINTQQQFRDSEGVLTFTAASAITAGSVVSCPSKDGGNGFVESGSFNPAGSGDNIIAYQGAPDDPFFLFGVGWARGASVWEYSEVSASYRSDIPPGLAPENYTITSLGTYDNHRCQNLTDGNRADILSWISDPDHYESSNSGGYTTIEGTISVSELETSASGSGEWTSLSWSNGLPDQFAQVSISGTVRIESAIHCQSLTIAPDARLEIHPGGSLTINGSIDNQAGENGLSILSDGSGSGALYHACEGVSGTVAVYLSADQWHFVAAPVSGAGSISSVFGTQGDHLYGVYIYDESLATWSLQLDAQVETMQGYNVYYQSTPKTIEFKGTLNSFRGRGFITVTKGTGGGWNLIGNPFACPMAFGKDVSNGADFSNYFGWSGQAELEHKTIYITTGGSGGATTWDTYNGTSGVGVPSNEVRNIALGQAFWVHAAANTDIGIGHYAKTKGSSSFKSDGMKPEPSILRRGDSEIIAAGSRPVLRFEALGEDGSSDQIAIAFHPSAKDGHERYDSKKFQFTTGPGIQLASLSDSIPCAINILQSRNPRMLEAHRLPLKTIPLSFQINKAQRINLSFQSVSESIDLLSIILEDRFLGIMHDFANQSMYEFHAGSGLLDSRFVLHLEWDDHTADADLVGRGDEIYQENVITVSQMGNSIIIDAADGPWGAGELKLFNLAGQELHHESFESLPYRFDMQADQGIYLLKIIQDQQQYSYKIWIQ